MFHGGNLFNHYIKCKDNFTELDCLRSITSILKGLAYLEEKKIIHRDIKPANIVLKQDNEIDNCFLIDFGLSVHSEDIVQKDAAIELMVGTPGYMAPEILRGETYDMRADVFSAGCTLYLLLFEKQLFYLKDKRECLELNRKCPFDKTLKEDLKKFCHDFDEGTLDLLKLMTQKDPKKRPYASELLKHPIIKVAEDFKNKMAKNDNLSKPKNNTTTASPTNKSKKAMGSMFNKIKEAFNNGSKSKSLKEFPSNKLTTNSGLSKLQTKGFKECVYVNCLPKTMEEMSDFVSDASTRSGMSIC